MTAYNISYDLTSPGRNYGGLYDAIRGISGTYCHALESTWLVVSSRTAYSIAEELRKQLDHNDKLLVTKVGDDAAWYGMPEEVGDWLSDQL
jgi:hypothetical protein